MISVYFVYCIYK